MNAEQLAELLHERYRLRAPEVDAVPVGIYGAQHRETPAWHKQLLVLVAQDVLDALAGKPVAPVTEKTEEAPQA